MKNLTLVLVSILILSINGCFCEPTVEYINNCPTLQLSEVKKPVFEPILIEYEVVND